jgi:pilus assembly protein CpaF
VNTTDTDQRTQRRALADEDAVRFYRRKLVDEINVSDMAGLNPAQQRARVERAVGRVVSRDGPMLSTAERTQLIRWIVDESIGLGVLEPLLADATVTEIMVNGPNEVWVERSGRVEQIGVRFSSESQLYQTIDRIVSRVNRRVDESSPMVDARLPTGERVNVIVPPLSMIGPVMTIRRFPRMFRMAELVAGGSVDDATARLLVMMVRVRLNAVISGGTGAGKTTLLNALSAFVPERERVITIEDNAELQLQRAHVIPLESRPANQEGRGAITIRDLVKNALRMRPDRIIVGEVRGAETLDMLQAMNTGHEGSLVTVHSNSAEDAVHRLSTLAMMTDLDLPFAAIRDQINSAVHGIVQIDRYPDGVRRIKEVGIVSSTRHEEFKLAMCSRFVPEPMRAGEPVRGRWVHGPLPPLMVERFELAGEEIPEEFKPTSTSRSRRRLPEGETE